jgi:ABC-type polysaccharide/polyol phosphate export permease
MRTLVVLNPITYGVDLMRAAIGQPHPFSAALDASLLVGFALGMCTLAFTSFRRSSH